MLFGQERSQNLCIEDPQIRLVPTHVSEYGELALCPARGAEFIDLKIDFLFFGNPEGQEVAMPARLAGWNEIELPAEADWQRRTFGARRGREGEQRNNHPDQEAEVKEETCPAFL